MNFVEEFLKTHKGKIDKEIRVLGIDLGTTNSTVAEVIWMPGKSPACKTPEIDQSASEEIYTSPILPSVVAILPDKKVLVGESAVKALDREYDRLSESVPASFQFNQRRHTLLACEYVVGNIFFMMNAMKSGIKK